MPSPVQPQSCASLLKDLPHATDVPGFAVGDIARSICRAVEYSADPFPASAISKARTTLWPDLAKSAPGLGGLQHVISADNAASYAELWSRGGSWYAVTGADPDGNILKKSQSWRVFDLTDPSTGKSIFHKDMPVEEATARFLYYFFGPVIQKSKPCNCRGKT